MTEIASTAQRDSTQKLWQNAAWYRALTLTERLATLHGSEAAFAGDLASHREMAQQRLQRWKEQTPFNRDSYFAQRLEMDGFSENDLLNLLAEPAESLQERVTTPPRWLLELADAFDTWESESDDLPLQAVEDAQARAFLQVFKPLLLRGCRRLQAGVQELVRNYADLPFEPETILPLFFARLSALLLPKVARTLVLELNVARVQGRLEGETPQERFHSFLQTLRTRAGILAIFEEYPVLARSLVETIERWATCEQEFLTRLCADWQQIRETFTPERDPGKLVEITEGAGDVHGNGRSVIIAGWSSGFRLVYKPRSLATDSHFQEALAWLNEKGYQPAFRALKLINQGAYGWIEFVQPHGCTSTEEIERFYRRQGGYLALLYALEASDFHAENVIAAGEYPVLIDMETLFHPRVGGYDELLRRLPGNDMMSRSVLRSGLLPQRIWSTDEDAGVDASGLGGKTRQRMPGQIALWTELGTDQMRLTKGEGEITFAHHRPLLNGQDVDTLAYCESIVAGFNALYRLLMQRRDEFLTEMLSRFAHDEIRCLLRPTRHYGLLLADSFHPNVLRDALDRDRLFDRLWIAVEQQYHLPRIIPAERTDLLNDDIPLFTSYPGTRDLITSQGAVVADLFEEPGLETARKRIQAFDEQDLEKQIWVIRASFTSLTLGVDGLKAFLHLQPSRSEVTLERLLTMARAVGDRLSRLAIASGDASGWLGVTPVREREWHVAPADAGLYSGTAGIALFLGYLGALTGEEKYTALAKAALQATRRQIEEQLKHPEQCYVGSFVGLGGLVYLLSHMATLWNEPALYREAEAIVRQLPDIIRRDEMFDMLGGSASGIASLLSLYAVAPQPGTLATAIQCGEHLIEHAQPQAVGIGWKSKLIDTPLSGFSHGNAGIALSLLRLFGVTREERFRETALAALRYERSLYSPERKNWLDLRKPVGVSAAENAEPSCMVAWCHGAAGIGLARLASLKYLDEAGVREEIIAAVQTTLARGFGVNHSLCHGDMGNAELLLNAALASGDPELREQFRQISAALLDSIDIQGWVSGIPNGVETPGLMTGLAGIGYALLRWAAPERIPSVLVLAPPAQA